MNKENLKLLLLALTSFAVMVVVITIIHQATTPAVVTVVEK